MTDQLPNMIPAGWKLGICDFSKSEPLQHADIIQDAGFDYIEPGLAKATELSARELVLAAQGISSRGFSVLSMNWFLPPSVKVTGPDVDPVQCRQYLDKAFAVADCLGARAIVFGSPGSRSIVGDFPMEQAWTQLIQFCQLCSDVIRENQYSIRIGVEHVNHTETNVLNKLAEVIDLVKQVNRPEIGVAIDFYHLIMENEPMETILAAEGIAVAVQLANPAARSFPKSGDDIPHMRDFFRMLRAIHYEGGIGIEAFVEDVAGEGASALAYLKRVITESL